MNHYEYQGNTSDNFYAPSSINHDKLWTESEITGKCVAPNISFSKEKRFKWASIYWPEDNDQLFALKRKKKSEVHEMAQKVSKMIDEEEKNQARIRHIKRSFSIGRSSTARKDSGFVPSTKKPFKLNPKNQQILGRLTLKSVKKQSLLRDRHGNRCNLYEDPELTFASDNVKQMSNSTGFKTSHKIDLNLPHNYYPGPGAYEIKRYLQDYDIKSARTAHTARTNRLSNQEGSNLE